MHPMNMVRILATVKLVEIQIFNQFLCFIVYCLSHRMKIEFAIFTWPYDAILFFIHVFIGTNETIAPSMDQGLTVNITIIQSTIITAYSQTVLFLSLNAIRLFL
jgi:hypothetical protein